MAGGRPAPRWRSTDGRREQGLTSMAGEMGKWEEEHPSDQRQSVRDARHGCGGRRGCWRPMVCPQPVHAAAPPRQTVNAMKNGNRLRCDPLLVSVTIHQFGIRFG